ncbi:hypothetical protein [Enterobacter sp. 638]|uniref:Ead/Ea22-like family protein n=1 Tax=Enterobacter sp. (strain 638) TaxID=399742 RepID=A0A9J9L093_ENT38|nr:hypothetical protein [Enterobacter sp. 638]ABP61291.1 hypothetical protein Ent638_2624 [Enterobacter sp. 638]
MTANKPMTSEQLSDLMTVAISMQRDSEKAGDRPAAMFAYAVQVAVLELRKVRADVLALAVENTALKEFIVSDCHVAHFEPDTFYEEEVTRYVSADGYEPETPATSAFLAEVRAQAHKEGAHFVANRMLAAWDAGFIEDTAKNAADIARMILTSTEFMPDAPEGDFDRSFADGVLGDIAAQLRQGDAV